MQIDAHPQRAVASRAPRIKLAARIGVLLADLLSGVLSALPLLFLYLVGMHLWLSAAGRGSDLVDEGSFAVAMVTPVLFLALALLPAVVVNLLLGRRTSWPVSARVAIAIVLILLPFIGALIWPEVGSLFTDVLR